MIIFGSRAKLLASKSTLETCNNCGTQQSVHLSIFQKYAHVFWIPFFPLGKTAVSECGHCKQALRTNEFPPSTKLSYDNLKRESKTPFWMFSGLALVAIFVVFSSYESKQNHKKNAALIQAPVKGDVFEIKTQDNQYTLYKVAGVEGDSVLIRFNRYETNKITGLSDLKRKGDEGYSEDIYSFGKSELKQMFEKGEIRDIERIVDR
jgi:hypothetical protein